MTPIQVKVRSAGSELSVERGRAARLGQTDYTIKTVELFDHYHYYFCIK